MQEMYGKVPIRVGAGQRRWRWWNRNLSVECSSYSWCAGWCCGAVRSIAQSALPRPLQSVYTIVAVISTREELAHLLFPRWIDSLAEVSCRDSGLPEDAWNDLCVLPAANDIDSVRSPQPSRPASCWPSATFRVTIDTSSASEARPRCLMSITFDRSLRGWLNSVPSKPTFPCLLSLHSRRRNQAAPDAVLLQQYLQATHYPCRS